MAKPTIFGKPYHDVHQLEEDARIRLIAETCRTGKVVAVLIDDAADTVARYRTKLEAAGCTITAEARGPVAGVVTLQVMRAH